MLRSFWGCEASRPHGLTAWPRHGLACNEGRAAVPMVVAVICKKCGRRHWPASRGPCPCLALVNEPFPPPCANARTAAGAWRGVADRGLRGVRGPVHEVMSSMSSQLQALHDASAQQSEPSRPKPAQLASASARSWRGRQRGVQVRRRLPTCRAPCSARAR